MKYLTVVFTVACAILLSSCGGNSADIIGEYSALEDDVTLTMNITNIEDKQYGIEGKSSDGKEYYVTGIYDEGAKILNINQRASIKFSEDFENLHFIGKGKDGTNKGTIFHKK